MSSVMTTRMFGRESRPAPWGRASAVSQASASTTTAARGIGLRGDIACRRVWPERGHRATGNPEALPRRLP